ncbi:GtrA family protein [Brevibacterium litoralis]|uniref:GtrA family protein n=1 Tax=Brevibacterium litoralis TaxID=3138935 RepID=UPI0032ECFD50
MGVRHEAKRVAKFSAVGGVAFVIDVLVFNLLRPDSLAGPIWAKIISVTLATLIAWVGSRYWTFKDGKRHSAAKEAVAFLLVNAGGLLIAVGCLWFSRNVLDLTSIFWDNVFGNVVGVGLGNIFRYFMYRFVVYKVTPRRPSLRREVVPVDA